MGMAFVPFDATNVFAGLHESLYADHTSLSSFVAVTTAALWSHLWHYPDNLYGLFDAWRLLDASYLQLLVPFLLPLTVWFGLERLMQQSENAFKAMHRIIDFERIKLSSPYDDAELKQCLEMMKKNRQDYEELLDLLDQFPGQREKADLDRLKQARKRTSGSGDIMRVQCGNSDSSDTDLELRKLVQNDSDSDGTSPEAENEPLWKYEGVRSEACHCQR